MGFSHLAGWMTIVFAVFDLKIKIIGRYHHKAILLTLLITVSWTVPAFSSEPAIIPWPKSVTSHSGSFRLNTCRGIAATDAAKSSAVYLQDILRTAGLDIELSHRDDGGKGLIKLIVSDQFNAKCVEAYRLNVEQDQITIEARGPAGVFYGVQSLLQLLPPEVYGRSKSASTWTVPAVEIDDAPRFIWRGLMIDISRHFFGKTALTKVLDRMAMHKLNTLHLHLTDNTGWRIEIVGYPKLTQIAAKGDYSDPSRTAQFLSRQDIKELIDYAAVRNIQIVPEIDMPGHARAAARAYPEFFDGDATFNPGNPKTFEFVQDILGQVAELFPSAYLHFGGDEVREHHWNDMPGMREFMAMHDCRNLHEVEAYFDRSVADFLVSKGKTPIGWDEVAGCGVNSQTVIQWWRGRQPEVRDKAIKDGFRLIISPADPVYLDYSNAMGEPGAPGEGNDNGPNSLEAIYNWEPIPDEFSTEECSRVLGVEAAVWTEYIETERYMEYMTFPRLAALAEVAWSPKKSRNQKQFLDRVDVQCHRYEALDINYRIPGDLDARYIRH
jgi:hexosaminidase